MCRMIAFIGGKRGKAQSAGLQTLYRAFRDGSKCDPYVKDAFGPASTCHPHGWGFVLYDGGRLHHYRSSLPAWQEDVPLPPVKGRNVYAIFHSRLASDPTLNSPICSHPFLAATDKEVLLLAHNGAVNPPHPPASRVVDSEWALAVMAKAGRIEKALPELKKRTRPNSALNLLVLAIPRDGKNPPAIHCLNFYKTDEPGRVAYYKMYTAGLAGGKVVLSSTFKDLGINGLANIQAAPFGQLFSFS